MVDAGLRAAGSRSGLFTSPHLIEPTERIQIDGFPVSREAFERAFNVVHEAAIKLDLDCHPTYFETVTAMALWMFREMHVQTAVLETGLGGRLDATNVVQPTLTVITPVDFDHEAYLGDTIESIAGEKAGILKPGVPAIFARQRPDALRVLDARAAALGIRVTHAEDFEVRDLQVTARGSRFSGIECPLAGEHQVENAVTAAQALMFLGVSPEGIAETRWPGRLEHVAPNPDTILDGAHNPAGARALARYLGRFYSDRKIWMIYAAMRDKAVRETLEILLPLASELVLTAPNFARAMPPEELFQITRGGHCEPDVRSAVDHVMKRVSAEDVVLITGSLYLVGEARKLFLHTTGGRW
jgi:dihydrofolate synthase/folylpolyglutamate synthase